MRLSVIAALALGLCTGSLVGGLHLGWAHATPSAPGGPSAAAQTGATAPVLVPMQTLLLQLQNSGETVSSSNDVVLHSRTVDNSYDATLGERRVGFSGVVSPLGMASQVNAGLDSTNSVAMSMGIGIFRGSRPRLTTNVISGGAESSTIIAYANQNTQWMCLVESATVGTKRAWFQLLPSGPNPGINKDFVNNMTIVVATRANPTQPWTVDGPRTLTTAERTACLTAWGKAQVAGIIPGTEPFPP